jgi:hypothetical protein
MSFQEIKAKCQAAIAHPHLGGADAKVHLLVPGRWGASPRKQIIKAKGAPFGEIISDADDKHLLVVFQAKEILDYLERIDEVPTKVRMQND